MGGDQNKEKLEEELASIAIPTSIYEKIKERIKDTGFTSVSSYVTHVLKEILAEERKKHEPSTREDEEEIKDRLRALGYIEQALPLP